MVFKKAPFGHYFRVGGHQKPTTPNDDWRPGADHVFHEYLVINVPFGPSVFCKCHLFEDDWLKTELTFRCAMLYMPCLFLFL